MNRTIAILGGTGKLGSALALRWAAAGESVVIGSRDRNRANQKAEQLRSRLNRQVSLAGGDYRQATAGAGIVVLTVPFPSQLPTLKMVRDELAPGTVLVDTTVPLAVTVGASFTHTITTWEGSAAQQLAAAAGDRISVTAAFHSISAGQLDSWPQPLDSDILVTGDDAQAKQTVMGLVEKIPNLRGIDAGPLEMARVTEQLTALLIGIGLVHGTSDVGIHVTGLDGRLDTNRLSG